MNTRKLIKIVLSAGIIAAPAVGWSATATTTFLVSATVINSCIVAATPLAFGNYDPTSATANTSTSTVSVTCTSSAPYNVGLDKGSNGASVTTRLLKSGANTLSYALYSDAARTTNWGNTVGTDTITGTGTGILQAFTVYGKIPAGAAAPAGAYTDTITVTVTY